MPGGNFNGVEMLWVGVIVLGILVALYARHRMSQDTPPERANDRSPDPDWALVREVRKSYDDLPYRGRSASGMSEARREQ